MRRVMEYPESSPVVLGLDIRSRSRGSSLWNMRLASSQRALTAMSYLTYTACRDEARRQAAGVASRGVLSKKSRATPRSVLSACRHRLRVYDVISAEEE